MHPVFQEITEIARVKLREALSQQPETFWDGMRILLNKRSGNLAESWARTLSNPGPRCDSSKLKEQRDL